MPVLTLRELKTKIRAAQKTQQITKTMQMVAASRLKKSEEKLRQSKPYFESMEMILSHLYEMLKEHEVKPVEVVGKQFDPHTSEALMQVVSELPENAVVEEMQKGYFLNDRVIRTAKVKVSKGKSE